MNNNMIKVLAVVVIAAGLWYMLSGDPAEKCVEDGGTWNEAAEAVVCGEDAAEGCVEKAAVEEGCVMPDAPTE